MITESRKSDARKRAESSRRPPRPRSGFGKSHGRDGYAGSSCRRRSSAAQRGTVPRTIAAFGRTARIHHSQAGFDCFHTQRLRYEGNSPGSLSPTSFAAVVERKNILVAGGTGSGKTTLVNAILAEPPFRNDRIVLIEDTKELQCPAEDKVELLTKNTEPRVTMTDLLRMTLRLRPDRIIIGEVRGPEALAMLKAWNTGHPGGVATDHANSAADGRAHRRPGGRSLAGLYPTDPSRRLSIWSSLSNESRSGTAGRAKRL